MNELTCTPKGPSTLQYSCIKVEDIERAKEWIVNNQGYATFIYSKDEVKLAIKSSFVKKGEFEEDYREISPRPKLVTVIDVPINSYIIKYSEHFAVYNEKDFFICYDIVK